MCIQGMHPFVDCVHAICWWWAFFFFLPLSPWRRCTRREKHIPVTRLSASLLTSWLFPDKYSRPLDSTPLSSRIMANYQEAVCWKDAARNYICLQTVLRFKHVLWKKKKEGGGGKATFRDIMVQKNQNCLQRIMWLLRNVLVMTNMRTGLFICFILFPFFFCQKVFTGTQMRHGR